MENLNYYKKNAETDYKYTPLSVLKYITALEYITLLNTQPSKPVNRPLVFKWLNPVNITKFLIVAVILLMGIMALISEI